MVVIIMVSYSVSSEFIQFSSELRDNEFEWARQLLWNMNYEYVVDGIIIQNY